MQKPKNQTLATMNPFPLMQLSVDYFYSHN